jgi:hypothetical protein
MTHMGLMERGVIPDPDGREPWLLCHCHSDGDIGETLDHLEQAV